MGAKGDKGKCTAARTLMKEALSIQRALSLDWMAAQTLESLASAHSDLEMFDEDRSTIKQALDLARCYHSEESKEVVACHQRMTCIGREQVKSIRAQVDMHMENMLTNSMHHYHSRGSRVLVEGLKKQPQYHGIEGVVLEMDALRMCVRLDTNDNKEVMLKPENVRPLFPTALKLQAQLQKLHDIAQERIANSKETRRIRIKVTGVKHVDAAIACQNLGVAYLDSHQPAEIGLAVSLLIQADKIRRRVGDDDKDRALLMS